MRRYWSQRIRREMGEGAGRCWFSKKMASGELGAGALPYLYTHNQPIRTNGSFEGFAIVIRPIGRSICSGVAVDFYKEPDTGRLGAVRLSRGEIDRVATRLDPRRQADRYDDETAKRGGLSSSLVSQYRRAVRNFLMCLSPVVSLPRRGAYLNVPEIGLIMFERTCGHPLALDGT